MLAIATDIGRASWIFAIEQDAQYCAHYPRPANTQPDRETSLDGEGIDALWLRALAAGAN